MSHSVLMSYVSCYKMIFLQLSGVIIIIFSLVLWGGGRLSDVLVLYFLFSIIICSSDVWLSVIGNGTCAYYTIAERCDLWSYSLLSFLKKMNPFIYFSTLAAVRACLLRFFWALSESLSKHHCNWVCYSVFQWDCEALVPSTSKAPLQHACRGCD